MEELVAIKVIVQFQARPGRRAEVRTLLRSIAATHGPRATGFRTTRIG
jgi:quinol monooxygenase YgiN